MVFDLLKYLKDNYTGGLAKNPIFELPHGMQ